MIRETAQNQNILDVFGCAFVTTTLTSVTGYWLRVLKVYATSALEIENFDIFKGLK
jgi:hypothetical protein